jgi:hypothetical protein
MDDNDGGGYGHNEAAGWYLDDIAIAGLPQSQPAEPYVLNMIISSGPAELNWYHPADDVAHVVVYGSPHQGFRPSLGTRLAILPADAHTYSDTAHPGWPNLFYRVSVVDIHGNESLPILPTTMIAAPETPPADAVVLRGVAPNPFNPITTIRFRLEQSARVELAVYDLAGRRVADLVREVLPAGDHAVPFAPRHLASGTYVARLVCEGRVMTAKMMLVR